MPDPREAVYDVLLAKKRRAEEAAAREALAAQWAEYEQANEVARAAYVSPRGARP